MPLPSSWALGILGAKRLTDQTQSQGGKQYCSLHTVAQETSIFVNMPEGSMPHSDVMVTSGASSIPPPNLCHLWARGEKQGEGPRAAQNWWKVLHHG